MKKRFLLLLIVLSTILFSCNEGFFKNSGSIRIDLPYGKTSSGRSIADDIKISYVFIAGVAPSALELDTNRLECKFGESGETITFSDKDAGEYQVFVYAFNQTKKEMIEKLVNEKPKNLITEINNLEPIYGLPNDEPVLTDVIAGETSNVDIHLRRRLLPTDKITSFSVEVPKTYEKLTFENYDEFLQKLEFNKKIVAYLGSEKLAEEDDEVKIGDKELVVPELSEKAVGKVTLNFDLISENIETDNKTLSEPIEVPVYYNYPVPDYDKETFITSYSAVETETLVIDGDPFGREYSDIHVDYYTTESEYPEEAVLILKPSKIVWYKNGNVIEIPEYVAPVNEKLKSEKTESEPEEFNFKLDVNTDKVETAKYYCKVTYTIESENKNALDFINQHEVQLKSPEIEVTITDADTTKELVSLKVTPKDESYVASSCQEIDLEKFVIESTYALIKNNTQIGTETKTVDARISSYPQESFGYVPVKFEYTEDDVTVETTVRIPVSMEYYLNAVCESNNSITVARYSKENPLEILPITVTPTRNYYYYEKDSDTPVKGRFTSKSDGNVVWTKNGVKIESGMCDTKTAGKSEYECTVHFVPFFKTGTDSTEYAIENRFLVYDDTYFEVKQSLEVTVCDYDIEISDGKETQPYDPNYNYICGNEYSFTLINDADFEKQHVKWECDTEYVEITQNMETLKFVVPEQKSDEQVITFTASYLYENSYRTIYTFKLTIPEKGSANTNITIEFPSTIGTDSLLLKCENHYDEEKGNGYLFTASSENSKVVKFEWRLNGKKIGEGETLFIENTRIHGKKLDCLAIDSEGNVIANEEVREIAF